MHIIFLNQISYFVINFKTFCFSYFQVFPSSLAFPPILEYPKILTMFSLVIDAEFPITYSIHFTFPKISPIPARHFRMWFVG